MSTELEAKYEIGRLCRYIRENQWQPRLSTQDIANLIGYDQSAIYKFERGERWLNEEMFGKYVKALQLGEAEEKLLIAMHKGSKERQRKINEARLELYNFELITKRVKYRESDKLQDQPKNLKEFLDKLQNLRFAAFIIDELWYIHAMNAPFIRLFALTKEHLENPNNWHTIAARYDLTSPICSRQKPPPHLDHRLIMRLFLESIIGYFYTGQTAALRHQLCKNSKNYQRAWAAMITMNPYPSLDEPPQHIEYPLIGERMIDGPKRAKAEMALIFDTPIYVWDDSPIYMRDKDKIDLKYRLVYLEPRNTDAWIVQDELNKLAGEHLVFAVSYGFKSYQDWFEKFQLPNSR